MYDRPILNCGYPRNDILVGLVEPYEKKIRKYFRLEEDVKLVLYAPTYRKGRELDKYTLDYDVVLDALTKKFGGNWKMLLKLHPTMRQRSEELKYEDNLIDASYYEDMQELLAGSNVLISDYSSVITEFAFTKKPVFLYATDISDYAGERDFYCDYYSLPFSIAQNNSQLVENIFKFESKTYGEGIVKCFEKFGIKESGNAAGIVADIIEEKIEKLEK